MFVLTEHIAMRRPKNVRPIYSEIASISHFLHFVWALQQFCLGWQQTKSGESQKSGNLSLLCANTLRVKQSEI